MRVKKGLIITGESIALFLVMLAILIENQFMRIIPIKNSIFIVLLLFLSVVAFVTSTSVSGLKCLNCDSRFILKYIGVVVIFGVVQFGYTFLRYNPQNIVSFFFAAQSYTYVLWIVPFTYLFSRKTGMIRSLERMMWLVGISLGLHLLHSVLYNLFGNELLALSFFKKIMIRNNRLRIWDISSLEALAIIFCFYKTLYSKKLKIGNILLLVIMFTSLLYLEQTRMMQIALIVSMIAMFVMKENKLPYAKLLKYLVVLTATIYILFSGIVGHIVLSFSESGQYGGSTTVRLHEIEYAVELIMKNPINGMGLLSNDILARFIRYYGMGKFDYTDIGILGTFAKIGLWVIPIYLWPMFRFWRAVRMAIRSRQEIVGLLIGLFCFLVISSTTLMVLDSQRMFMWPWCIAIFEYCGYCLRNNEKIS